MNYQRIYISIIIHAQSLRTERLILKRQGKYFEQHHIIPRSLNGSNDINNLCLLTAREHFVCHWLLIKMYPDGSMERNKMLCALWKMKPNTKTATRKYINSHVYEYLRIQFAQAIRTFSSKANQGKRNPRYGYVWYTNSHDGKSQAFNYIPSYPWVKGRYLFRGENSQLSRTIKEIHRTSNDPIDHRKRTQYQYDERIRLARIMWDDYHSHNYSSLRDYAAKKNYGKKYVVSLMKLIPAYDHVFIGRSHNNGSKAEWVAHYI